MRVCTGTAFLLFLLVSCKKTNGDTVNQPVQTPVITAPAAPVAGDNPYKLVWFDEFNGNGLPDTTKWGYDVGGSGWGNNELEYYTKARAENARVINGQLVIEARKELYNRTWYYSSARLHTKHTAQWTYGRFDIKARIPRGTGTWPTIWMLPGKDPRNWPADGELDIMEAVGYKPNLINGVAHTLLYNGANGLYKSGNILIPDAQDSFHVYSIEWTEKMITWFVDGNSYFTYTDPGLGVGGWPYKANFYLLLNIAVGGNYGGKEGVDDSIFPQQMVIDYVRVYQKKP